MGASVEFSERTFAESCMKIKVAGGKIHFNRKGFSLKKYEQWLADGRPMPDDPDAPWHTNLEYWYIKHHPDIEAITEWHGKFYN